MTRVFAAPMELVRDGTRVGTIVTYGYETPWASGRLEPADSGEAARWVAVSAFEAWGEANEDAGDASYEAERRARGLSEADVAAYARGPWSVVTADGTAHPVGPPQFDGNGYVTWRW